MAITQSFFKLGIRNFAWQQIYIIPTDHTYPFYTIPYHNIPYHTKYHIFQTTITQSFFKLEIRNFTLQQIQILSTDHFISYYTIKYQIPNISNSHNSVIFKTSILKFSMEVDLDNTHTLYPAIPYHTYHKIPNHTKYQIF